VIGPCLNLAFSKDWFGILIGYAKTVSLALSVEQTYWNACTCYQLPN